MQSTQLLLAVSGWLAFTALFAFKTKRQGNFNPVHTAIFAAFVAAWFWFVTYVL